MKKLLFIIVLLSAPAYAQNINNTQFRNYLTTNTEYNDLLNLNIERIFRITYPDCDSPIKPSKSAQNILMQPSFPPRPEMNENGEKISKNRNQPETKIFYDVPNFGQWIERSKVEACDKTLVINHLVVAYDASTPLILPLLNGTTRINVIDQPYAEKAISSRLQKQVPPCDGTPFIKDTNLIGYRSLDGKTIDAQNKNNGWFEKWNVQACGANHLFNIAALPDPQTRYNYEVQLLPPQ